MTCNNATLTINVVGSSLGLGSYPLMTATNATGVFSALPNITGLGLGSAFYSAYVSTSAGGNVTLTVYRSYTWLGLDSNDPGNNWSYQTHWSIVPNAAGEIAAFGYESSYTKVNLDVPETIGGIQFNNTNSFGIIGNQTLTLNNNGNGASITVLNGSLNSVAVPLSLSENLAVNASSGAVVTLAGAISGAASLSMGGSGTLVLSNANTYSKGMTINGGTVKLGNSLALGSAATNTIGAGTLDLNGQTLNSTPTSVILMTGGGTLQNSNASPVTVYQPIIQTSGTVGNIRGNGNITILQWSGTNAFNVTNFDTGTLDLAGTNDNAFLQLHSFAGTVLLDKVGASSVHAASLLDVEGGLVKVTGTNGDEIYDANTLTVNSGTFDLNGHSELVGSLAGASSAGVILNNAAGTTNTLTVTLVTGGGNTAYNGTIADGAGKLALVIGEAGTLGGTNLFTGGLTLNGGVIGGTLTVSNTFPTNLTITVANGSVLNLAFSVTNQINALVLGGVSQAPGVYKSGMSSLITGAGALQVLSGPTGPTGPANLTNSVSGNTLSLSWPAGQGWRLQMQTNSLSVGLGTNWVYITDGTISSTNITLARTNAPMTLYRLRYP